MLTFYIAFFFWKVKFRVFLEKTTEYLSENIENAKERERDCPEKTIIKILKYFSNHFFYTKVFVCVCGKIHIM